MTTRRRFLQTVAVAGVSSCVSRIAAADCQQSSLKSISPASILIDRCTIARVGHIDRDVLSRRAKEVTRRYTTRQQPPSVGLRRSFPRCSCTFSREYNYDF